MGKDICQEYFDLFNEDRNCYTPATSASERRQVFKVNAKYKSLCCCIKVDGCIIPKDNKDERCDYLFIIKHDRENWYLFVELKGGGVSAEKCVKQLINTIEHFKNKYKVPSNKDKIMGFIVGGDSTAKMTRLKEDFLKKYKGNLIHKSGNKQSYEFS
jgi:hypothetical protein